MPDTVLEGSIINRSCFCCSIKGALAVIAHWAFSNRAILNKIDRYTELLNASEAVEANFEKWPVLNEFVWPNNYIRDALSQRLIILEIGLIKDSYGLTKKL